MQCEHGFIPRKNTHTKKTTTTKKKKKKKKKKRKKNKKKNKQTKNKKNSRILATEYTLVRLLFRYLDYYDTVLLIILTSLNPTFIL